MVNGNELVGEIVREDGFVIVLKSDGVESKVMRSHIRQITYVHHEEEENEELIFTPKDEELNMEVVAGATLGTPAAVNLRIGLRGERTAVHFSGAYWGVPFGIQLSPMLILSKDEKTYHYLTGMLGYAHLEEKVEIRDIFSPIIVNQTTWAYAGAGYALNTRGFFLELGLTAGVGSFRSPQLMFQIGYVN